MKDNSEIIKYVDPSNNVSIGLNYQMQQDYVSAKHYIQKGVDALKTIILESNKASKSNTIFYYVNIINL